MNELKFNSQVCTTREQSQRLLELGLKPETADCHYLLMDDNWSMGFGFWKQPHQNIPTHYVPAWSLHRLLCMLDYDNADTFNIMPNLAYEDVIATISLRINCGAFNKEYLKQ